MQEIWDNVSVCKSIMVVVRALAFWECRLYEASDLLLSDYLDEKSDTVK